MYMRSVTNHISHRHADTHTANTEHDTPRNLPTLEWPRPFESQLYKRTHWLITSINGCHFDRGICRSLFLFPFDLFLPAGILTTDTLIRRDGIHLLANSRKHSLLSSHTTQAFYSQLTEGEPVGP